MILWNEVYEGANLYPFYIGYHRNAQNNWVWYDYDLNDVEVSFYQDRAKFGSRQLNLVQEG